MDSSVYLLQLYYSFNPHAYPVSMLEHYMDETHRLYWGYGPNKTMEIAAIPINNREKKSFQNLGIQVVVTQLN